MDEQQQDPDQSQDQSGEGYFLSVDLLDELMGSLAAVYGQLLLNEKRKLSPETATLNEYEERRNEILVLKESFPITGTSQHNEVSSLYTQELSQARVLLETSYSVTTK